MNPKLFFLLFGLTLIAADVIAQPCSQPGSIISVTKHKSGRTEYVIFNLKMPTTVAPVMTTAHPPFTEDPSGNPVSIAGCRYKSIRMNNVVWTCTIAENLSNATYLVRKVKKIGQFEGVVQYIIGYRCNTKSVISYSYEVGSLKKFVVRLRY